MSAALPAGDRAARLRALRARFLAEAGGDLAELGRLLAAGAPGPGPAERRARKLAHDLRGSGGSYGFMAVSAAAAALEDALRAGAPDLAGPLAALGDALRAAGAPDEAP